MHSASVHENHTVGGSVSLLPAKQCFDRDTPAYLTLAVRHCSRSKATQGPVTLYRVQHKEARCDLKISLRCSRSATLASVVRP